MLWIIGNHTYLACTYLQKQKKKSAPQILIYIHKKIKKSVLINKFDDLLLKFWFEINLFMQQQDF